MNHLTEELVTLIEEGDRLIMPSHYINNELKKVQHEYECQVITVSSEKEGDKIFFLGIVVKFQIPNKDEPTYRFFLYDEIEFKFKHEKNVILLKERLNKS